MLIKCKKCGNEITEEERKLYGKYCKNCYELKSNTDNQNNKSLKNNKLIKFICIISIIIIIILIANSFVLYMYPKNCIGKINESYTSQQYDKTARYKSKLDLIKRYLKNDDEYYKIQYKVKLSEAIELYKNQNYIETIETLKEIKNTDNEVIKKINDCKYELGKQYFEQKQYSKSIEYLNEVKEKSDIEELKDKAHYNLALEILSDKDYTKAMEEIKKVNNKELEGLEKTRKQIHYEYGKYFLNRGDYNGGISQLEQAKDYEDAKTLVNFAYIEKAEKLIKENKLGEARSIYNYLEESIEHDGIKVLERKKQLNNAESMINATGKKYASKSYCESRNVWKYDGRWENWFIDKPDSYEYIDTILKLNNDGTYTLSGRAYFYAFNNFSTLQKYCNADIISKNIEIKNISSIPAKYNIDEYTTLLFSNGKFKIQYNKKDDYSTNFYNVYSSSITY